MKSSREALAKRGYIDQSFRAVYENASDNDLLALLESDSPQQRTVSAFLLGKRKNIGAVEPLCELLVKEKRLYTKIAASDALVHIGSPSIAHLIHLLGKIGNNQHKSLPKKPFKKNNYPLPRDIAARTLIRIGKPSLPALQDLLKSGCISQISEGIDAIGYISWDTGDMSCLSVLRECLNRYASDELIFWKIIRAFQAFPVDWVIDFLESVVCESKKKEYIWEAHRSLSQIRRRKNRSRSSRAPSFCGHVTLR